MGVDIRCGEAKKQSSKEEEEAAAAEGGRRPHTPQTF